MNNQNMNSLIGAWLAGRRKEKGMSQQEVADRLGTTRTAVHYWESGKRTIYAVNLIEYCKAINVNPSEIVEELYKN